MAKSIKNETKVETAPEVISAQPATPVQPASKPETKMSKAVVVFTRAHAMERVPARKDILAAAREEAGLTPAQAATYYQNWKAKQGLVNHKAKAPVTA